MVDWKTCWDKHCACPLFALSHTYFSFVLCCIIPLYVSKAYWTRRNHYGTTMLISVSIATAMYGTMIGIMPRFNYISNSPIYSKPLPTMLRCQHSPDIILVKYYYSSRLIYKLWAASLWVNLTVSGSTIDKCYSRCPHSQDVPQAVSEWRIVSQLAEATRSSVDWQSKAKAVLEPSVCPWISMLLHVSSTQGWAQRCSSSTNSPKRCNVSWEPRLEAALRRHSHSTCQRSGIPAIQHCTKIILG